MGFLSSFLNFLTSPLGAVVDTLIVEAVAAVLLPESVKAALGRGASHVWNILHNPELKGQFATGLAFGKATNESSPIPVAGVVVQIGQALHSAGFRSVPQGKRAFAFSVRTIRGEFNMVVSVVPTEDGADADFVKIAVDSQLSYRRLGSNLLDVGAQVDAVTRAIGENIHLYPTGSSLALDLPKGMDPVRLLGGQLPVFVSGKSKDGTLAIQVGPGKIRVDGPRNGTMEDLVRRVLALS